MKAARSPRSLFSAVLAAVLVVGCVPEPAPNPVDDRDRVPELPDDDDDGDPYTPEMLQAYKRALPRAQLLKAPQPESEAEAQLGDAAAYPAHVAPQVMGVNALVTSLIATLEAVTALPPSIYNSDTQEFVWGPFDDDNSALAGDKALLYIKDNGEGADFRYSYAFVRGMGDDLATYAPVIWGGTSPGASDDEGTGLVLYDFEANRAWEDVHNPGHGALPEGRFAIVFGRGPAEDNADAMVTLVLSTFRGFKDGDHLDAQPANLDQLYGHVENVDGAGTVVDFVSIVAAANVHPEEDPTSLPEVIDLRLAFVNGGLGRAEAVVTGGDLAGDNGGSVVLGVECWDALLARTHLNLVVEGELAAGEADGQVTLVQEGELSMCGELFSNTLADLEVPSLDDVDPAHLAALDEIATNGLQ